MQIADRIDRVSLCELTRKDGNVSPLNQGSFDHDQVVVSQSSSRTIVGNHNATPESVSELYFCAFEQSLTIEYTRDTTQDLCR